MADEQVEEKPRIYNGKSYPSQAAAEAASAKDVADGVKVKDKSISVDMGTAADTRFTKEFEEAGERRRNGSATRGDRETIDSGALGERLSTSTPGSSAGLNLGELAKKTREERIAKKAREEALKAQTK